MALTSIFSNARLGIEDKTNSLLTAFQFDAHVSEIHKSTVRVTSNPVEFGVPLNDHAILEPRELSIVGVISNVSLFGIIGGIQNIANPLPGLQNFTSAGVSRVQTKFIELLNEQLKMDVVTVHTHLATYRNMMITEVSVQVKSTEYIEVNMNLREVNIVETMMSGPIPLRIPVVIPSVADQLAITQAVGTFALGVI